LYIHGRKSMIHDEDDMMTDIEGRETLNDMTELERE
jgi:hypothetical protein